MAWGAPASPVLGFQVIIEIVQFFLASQLLIAQRSTSCPAVGSFSEQRSEPQGMGGAVLGLILAPLLVGDPL